NPWPSATPRRSAVRPAQTCRAPAGRTDGRLPTVREPRRHEPPPNANHAQVTMLAAKSAASERFESTFVRVRDSMECEIPADVRMAIRAQVGDTIGRAQQHAVRAREARIVAQHLRTRTSQLPASQPEPAEVVVPMPIALTMSAAEASKALHVSLTTLGTWARLGRISAHRQHGQWRYPRPEIFKLAAFVNRLKPARRPAAPQKPRERAILRFDAGSPPQTVAHRWIVSDMGHDNGDEVARSTARREAGRLITPEEMAKIAEDVAQVAEYSAMVHDQMSSRVP